MVHSIADIMTTKLVTLPSDASLREAHEIVREKGIRHIPVVDKDSGRYLGVVTQKRMIAAVMNIMADYGPDAIERRERHYKVADLIEADVPTVTPDASLRDVADYFLFRKHGCLPVMDAQGQLVGIVTSSDFVRLCARLLDAQGG